MYADDTVMPQAVWPAIESLISTGGQGLGGAARTVEKFEEVRRKLTRGKWFKQLSKEAQRD